MGCPPIGTDTPPPHSKGPLWGSYGVVTSMGLCTMGPPHVPPYMSPPAFTFFDPNDAACREILQDPSTSVPQLFAILRQWVPQVQHNVDLIGNEVRGGQLYWCVTGVL
uniref:Uncharacterized protein n=1 Tax=Melopsittacus undulatus TaxID=13146 RepID=A0A8V5H0X8_MELUD